MVEQGNGIRNPRLKRRFLLIGLVLLPITGFLIYRQFANEPAGQSSVVGKVSSQGARKVELETPSITEGTTSSHPLDAVLKIARDSLDRMHSEVVDYTGIMVKRERVSGKLSPEAKMQMKIIAANPKADPPIPIHVYLKFEQPSSAKGREVIWIEGRNGNSLVAHEAGMLNLVRANLDPTGTLAMMGNKYPITEIGLENLVKTLIKKGERDRAFGDCQVEVEEGHEVDGHPCKMIRVTHPEKRDGFDFHIAEVLFDSDRMLPLRYASYLWPSKAGDEPPLEEEYTFLDLKINVGLTEADFDPNNKAYNYP